MTTDVAAAVAGADVVVEAVSEDLELKREVFATLGGAAGDGTVIASNTSGLPIEVLGSASGRPSQVSGSTSSIRCPPCDWWRSSARPSTTDETVARGVEFARAVGKETVEVRDMPGFVTTRLGTLLMCEGIRAYEQGVASAEHIDTAMKLGYNHPMGPLELADRVGLDTVLYDPRRPARGVRRRVRRSAAPAPDGGRRGSSAGRADAGFYDY